ncbi:hypothetical protein AN640_04660 [Candidatus Epulonipiscium fishelsonii]|uniref:Uncharacterized protein n=1 Tax=Candidatus Epulonipiscium fishelsonii TaxID=77094 RepID=A0ACC8XIU8_9FIRM|nr:hypothetical protein AN640_04660 [Epulopiscium sp. SCG-D08WGA-EpuloA1]OON93774.1 MAG: hypothetical protein ATN32_08670 [Epulopiscium sp. AS2M-Bin002]
MGNKNGMGSWIQTRVTLFCNAIKNSLKFSYSLFSKLFILYISIVAVILIVMFTAFYNIFESYFVQYTQEILISQDKIVAFIRTPLPQILEILNSIRNIGIILLIASFFPISIIIYIISKQITNPLKEMNYVAKKIANGEFDKRIEINSQDEIGQLANSLNYMASELDKIEENRKTFIANVSHDLRSPLTSIQGFIIAILDGTIPSEKQERYLNIVLNESQRMIKMTNDILELNKLEETNNIKKILFDMHQLIG